MARGDDGSDGDGDPFHVGRLLGELISDVKGLRVDLNTRHAENTIRLDTIENKQREFEAKLAKLWLFRGRLLLVGGLFLVAVHFIADAIVQPVMHAIGIPQ